jgi:hypothetical protein
MIQSTLSRGGPVTEGRILYISPLDLGSNNGMLQRQIQILRHLASRHPGQIDFLSLGSSPKVAEQWSEDLSLPFQVLRGWFAHLARLNTWIWYVGNVILCNKLGLYSDFKSFWRTQLPARTAARYSAIYCYYPWGFLLLGLDRFGEQVVVDLGDVMAQRHDRIGVRRWISLSREAEASILDSRARCLAISQDDRDEFERLYGTSLPVVPFVPAGIETLISIPLDDPPSVGYLAALGYQNEEVVKALTSEVFQSAIAAKGLRLTVAGGICQAIAPEQRAAIERGNGRILGRVASVQDFYRQVAVILNPVGPSTGVKIKSVEALVSGRRLVTTPFGVDADLQAAFDTQITLIRWPIDPHRLALAALEAMGDPASVPGSRSSPTGLSPNLEKYLDHTRAAMLRYL